MLSLQDLLGSQQGSEAMEQITNTVGAEPSMVNSAISAALPAILGGLANNAATPEGANSLDSALEEDHAGGGILGNLGGLAGMIFGQPRAAEPPPTQANAGGILSHIFGDSQGAVAQDVSQKSGLGMGQVAQILMMLAPIVMGYLGKQKQEQNVGADGLGGLLGGLLGQGGGGAMDVASSVLDRNHDGSAMDDIASMAFQYMANR
jgi:hypothetical protein